MSTQGPFVRYARGGRRRKRALNVDLNIPLPIENQEQVGGSAIPVVQGGQGDQLAIPDAQGGQGDQPAIPVAQGGQGDQPAITVARSGLGHQPEGSAPPAPIDLEELDDDVVISSPRAFQEAKSKSQRIRRTLVVDVESEEGSGRRGLNQGNKRRRGPSNQPVINCESYVNLEGSSGSMRKHAAQPPPPPPPPKEPTFSCPVCMGPLVEEVTTKCGHIFCKACIKAAISAQPKCPTCRRKVTNRDIIRVYLPTTK